MPALSRVRRAGDQHPADGARRRPWGLTGPLLVPALTIAAVAALALTLWHTGGQLRLYVDDLAQLLAAALASAAGAWAAARQRGRLRVAWSCIAVATGAWAAGQVVWCWYELGRGNATPFPSVADAGFLLCSAASAVGLLAFPPRRGLTDRLRWALDSCTVVCALLTVSWSTTLGAVAHAGGTDRFGFAVSLAYPIGDILVLSMAISALCRPGAMVRELVVLSAAMIAMAIADSGFTYLTSTNSYLTGGAIDIGWIAAFLLIGIAAWDSAVRVRPAPAADDGPARPAAVSMLPYLPVVIAAGVLAVRYGLGHPFDAVQLLAMSLTLGLVLVRQYLTVRENRDLIDTLAAREAELQRQAFHDLLTGLANRALFANRVEHALQLHRRDQRPLAVLFCDLDDFKMVNDTLGHAAGDELLKHVAQRLRTVLRPGDTVARIGGDEFAVLLEHGYGATAVAQRLIDSFTEPAEIAGVPLSVRASVGLAELNSADPPTTVDELLAHADIAMYAAKRGGKGVLARWHAGMTTPHADDLKLRQPLTAAVTDRLITLAYQPIVHMNGGVLGFESLARWTHDGVPVGPNRFIPVAQRAGLLHALTEHVLDQAGAQAASWARRLGHHRLRVGVNIPSQLLTDLQLPGYVARTIDRYGLHADQLVLEITEDALIEDFDAARRVALMIRDLGPRLSVDDFGQGYSALVRLQQFPLHSLKIDKSFIDEIDAAPDAERFVAALLALAGDLGLEVVAEGIERPGQADVLRRLGCQYGQGYLFARPQAAELIDPARDYSVVESVAEYALDSVVDSAVKADTAGIATAPVRP